MADSPDGPKRIVVEIPRPTAREADDDYKALLAKLRDLVNAGYTEIYVDVSAVPFADSVLLGAIANAFMTASRKGCTLKLLRPTPSFRELLHVTKLDRILEIAKA